MQKQDININPRLLFSISAGDGQKPVQQSKDGPLIKWPGGKNREFGFIQSHIPKFDRYVEPFFGGGAVFFMLKPKKAAINDACVELMDFYRFLSGAYDTRKFSKEIYDYVFNWEKIPNYILLFQRQFISLYAHYAAGTMTKNELSGSTTDYIQGQLQAFNGLFRADFCIDRKNLEKRIIDNLIDKISRMRNLERHHGSISLADLRKNIETAFRSGFYMHFRDLLNGTIGGSHDSHAKKIANYYFIREFCYGSMFRFNDRGEFNIPYGGIAYNSKNFKKKVDRLFSPEIHSLLRGVSVHSEDFQVFLDRIKLSSSDFVFLDPPYDTDFSDYQKRQFDRNDQVRLARYLHAMKAKFVLVVKKTPLMSALYKNKRNIHIFSFEKTYAYNMKGRNDRSVRHLIIKNF